MDKNYRLWESDTDCVCSAYAGSKVRIVWQNMQRSVLPIIFVRLPHSGQSMEMVLVDIMPAQKYTNRLATIAIVPITRKIPAMILPVS